MKSNLLKKYDVPVPRYTSYPTVPYWQEERPSQEAWAEHVADAFELNQEVSLYIHLPYCERLCTYCGCNKRITTNHAVEGPYIERLLEEWQLYLDALPGKPILKELHLGGGTPSFFAAQNLEKLLSGIYEGATIPADHDYGFEAHPANTTAEHLRTLHRLGFNRLSLGVQDFDDEILRVINRFQTEEQVLGVTQAAREIGFTSINYDLIFGLPFQTPTHIERNMEKINRLRPERIAFYSYAHVPWLKPSQRAYSEVDLPVGEEKRKLYELGRQRLEEMGYTEIGMDHFALPGDKLLVSMKNGTLHRNFMGYTTSETGLCIAIGASSISDTWDAFAQNEKEVEAWAAEVQAGRFPLIKGHFLTEEDQILRRHILNIMCQFRTNWQAPDLQCEGLYAGLERLAEFEADGLLEIQPYHLHVTEAGRPFIRNICLALDAHYWEKQPQGRLFSQAV